MMRCVASEKSDTLLSERDARSVQYPAMCLTIIIHEEHGGYRAEVPAIPGCATQGDTFEELRQNLDEAITGCLEVTVD